MAGRGKPPLPNNVRLLQGLPPRRPSADVHDGDLFPVAAPPPPAWLVDPVALAEWHRVVPLLLGARILAEVDQSGLATYCADCGRLALAEQALNAERARLRDAGQPEIGALTMTTPTGFEREALLSRLVGELAERVAKWRAEFGLAPAHRSRVAAAVGMQADLFDDNSAARFFR